MGYIFGLLSILSFFASKNAHLLKLQVSCLMEIAALLWLACTIAVWVQTHSWYTIALGVAWWIPTWAGAWSAGKHRRNEDLLIEGRLRAIYNPETGEVSEKKQTGA